VWVDGEPPGWLRAGLFRRYRLARTLTGEERVVPMTGYMSAAGMVTPWNGAQHEYVRRD
jgi:hypothetical protein